MWSIVARTGDGALYGIEKFEGEYGEAKARAQKVLVEGFSIGNEGETTILFPPASIFAVVVEKESRVITL